MQQQEQEKKNNHQIGFHSDEKSSFSSNLSGISREMALIQEQFKQDIGCQPIQDPSQEKLILPKQTRSADFPPGQHGKPQGQLKKSSTSRKDKAQPKKWWLKGLKGICVGGAIFGFSKFVLKDWKIPLILGASGSTAVILQD